MHSVRPVPCARGQYVSCVVLSAVCRSTYENDNLGVSAVVMGGGGEASRWGWVGVGGCLWQREGRGGEQLTSYSSSMLS
jgi:hypothetical protein